MFRSIIIAFMLAIWPAAALAQPSSPPPAEAFAAPPVFQDISLSPSGRQIAVIVQRDSLFHIEVWPVGADEPAASYSFNRARAPNWIRWKSEDRLLVSVSLPTNRFGMLVNESRLMSFTSALTDPVLMNQDRRRRNEPPFQDNIIDMLPDSPDEVLIQAYFSASSGQGVYRANARTGRITEIQPGNPAVRSWMTGPDGRVVLGIGHQPGQAATLYRVEEGGRRVEQLVLPGVGDHIFEPAAFDRSTDRLVVRSNHEGGTTGLYVYDLAQGRFSETLFLHDQYDVIGPIMSADGRQVLGAGFLADTYHVAYFDQATLDRNVRIAERMDAEEVLIVERSRDGRHVIAVETEHGRTIQAAWIDLETDELRPVGRGHVDPLAQYEPSPVWPVTYAARDGVTIPAYVTLPRGVTLETAGDLPFVVMPHGGPHVRDTADFDFLAQFVASRGYGVLQPNFRGSTGYGEAFRAAGEREWGGAILNDVEDGARWLLAEGMADEERMCVVGWSFGGYLSLMSGFRHGELFQCASAVAPVTDLPDLIDHTERYRGGDEVMRRMVGRAWRDRSRLVAESPARRANDFVMPVLIAHGDIDDVVPIGQSEKMAEALSAAGLPVEFLSIPWADHSLSRSRDRLRYLEALDAFLARHIGQAGTEPAAPWVPRSE